MFSRDNTNLVFLIDHTFFHDYFRTNYPHSDVVDWLFHYTHDRNTFTSEKIIIVPEITFNKVQFEFPIYYGITPSVIKALHKIMDIFPIEDTEDTEDNVIASNLLITIIVANSLLSKDIRPIIVSSVNEDKWLGHIHKWGFEMGLEGFTKVMSDRRIHNKFPCELIDTKKTGAKEILSLILSTYDSEYQEIIRYISP